MKLHKLQKSFADAAIDNNIESFAPQIVADGALSAAERMSVYHHNVVGRLADVLGEIFVATRMLTGNDFFRTMVRQFIPGHLPMHADMNRYGAALPDFIASYFPAQSLPYLADVARFEWLWNESFLAANDDSLDVQEISAVHPEAYAEMRLCLRDSARLFASHYPVYDIWAFCMAEGKEGIQPPVIQQEQRSILLLRPGLDVVALPLAQAEYAMLCALQDRHTLEEAANATLQYDHAFDLTAFLATHFAQQTFRSLSLQGA